MDKHQFQMLIGIRERLMIQLMMVTRLIDYYLAHCQNQPTIELRQLSDVQEDDDIEFIPEDDDIEFYADFEEDDDELD